MLAGGYQIRNGIRIFSGSGFPKSGTSGTGVDAHGEGAPTGSIYVDKTTGVAFVNEGSVTSPYWSPLSANQRGLLCWRDDFSHGQGIAIADTATSFVMPSGVRVSGQGLAETDSGFVISATEAGYVGTATTTDEDLHAIVLSPSPLAGTVALMQPDQNDVCVVDVICAQSSAITARRQFIGFSANATIALDPLLTGATTTITLADTISDDIAGLYFDAGLTDADRYYGVTDKGNTSATLDVSAVSDTGVDQAAAGTYQRFRVEVDSDGGVRMFIDKALVATKAAGTLDTDEEIHPVWQMSAAAAAVKTALVKSFAAWGKRP